MRRALIAVILPGAIWIGLTAASVGQPAGTSVCEPPPLAGTWRRTGKAATQELVRLEIIHRCTPDQRGAYAVLPGHEWTIRAFAKCRPRNCAWGRNAAQLADDGKLYGVFVTFSAQRSLRISPFGNRLQVDIAINYHNEARTAETASVLFERVR